MNETNHPIQLAPLKSAQPAHRPQSPHPADSHGSRMDPGGAGDGDTTIPPRIAACVTAAVHRPCPWKLPCDGCRYAHNLQPEDMARKDSESISNSVMVMRLPHHNRNPPHTFLPRGKISDIARMIITLCLAFCQRRGRSSRYRNPLAKKEQPPTGARVPACRCPRGPVPSRITGTWTPEHRSCQIRYPGTDKGSVRRE